MEGAKKSTDNGANELAIANTKISTKLSLRDEIAGDIRSHAPLVSLSSKAHLNDS